MSQEHLAQHGGRTTTTESMGLIAETAPQMTAFPHAEIHWPAITTPNWDLTQPMETRCAPMTAIALTSMRATLIQALG